MRAAIRLAERRRPCDARAPSGVGMALIVAASRSASEDPNRCLGLRLRRSLRGRFCSYFLLPALYSAEPIGRDPQIGADRQSAGPWCAVDRGAAARRRLRLASVGDERSRSSDRTATSPGENSPRPRDLIETLDRRVACRTRSVCLRGIRARSERRCPYVRPACRSGWQSLEDRGGLGAPSRFLVRRVVRVVWFLLGRRLHSSIAGHPRRSSLRQPGVL